MPPRFFDNGIVMQHITRTPKLASPASPYAAPVITAPLSVTAPARPTFDRAFWPPAAIAMLVGIILGVSIFVQPS